MSGNRIQIFVGGLMVAAAAAVSNHYLEVGLLHQPAGSLAWGPALFRILLAWHGLWLAAAGMRPAKPSSGRVLRIEAPVSRSAWIFLAALSVVAAALRLWELDSCMWLDEVLTVVGFVRLPVHDIVSRFPDQNQHMLYSLLAHASTGIFGEHAWSVRLPSVFFGVGSIWALFLLGRKLIGVRESLLACCLMTVSYHHVWFSQNARGYMGLMFFATLATYCWLEAAEREERWPWVAYAATLALGMWIHITMLFVAAAHAIVWMGTVVGRWRRNEPVTFAPVAAWLLSATLTLQLLALSLPEFLRSALHEASMNSEWTKPTWVITEMIRSLRIGLSGTAALLAAAALVLVGWWTLYRRNRAGAMAMILPAILGGALMLALSHNIWPRFFFFCMGFVLLIVIHGAMEMPRLVLRNQAAAMRAGTAFAALFIVASAFTLPRCYALPKQDFSGARDFVERSRKPGSRAVAAGLAVLAYRGYYAPAWDAARSAAELDEIRRRDPDVLLVYTLPIQIRAFDPAMWRMIDGDFEVVKVFPGTLGGGEVYVGRPRALSTRGALPPLAAAAPVHAEE